MKRNLLWLSLFAFGVELSGCAYIVIVERENKLPSVHVNMGERCRVKRALTEPELNCKWRF